MTPWSKALFVLLFSATAANAADGVWRIHVQNARCIQENLDRYRDTAQEPVVIVVNSCPETDLSKALGQASTNSGLFKVEDGDDVIVLSRKELECFARVELPSGDETTVSIARDGLCN